MSSSVSSFMYFVALVCPPELNEKILFFKHWMKAHFGCTVALKSPAHITLIAPFWLADNQTGDLMKAFGSFVTEQEPLPISLNGFSHFGRMVLFLQVEQNNTLEQLYQQVMDHFLRSLPGVIKKERRPFHPHVTIANRDLHPAAFIKAWKHFSAKSFSESFTADVLSLLKLDTGKWSVIATRNWNPAA